MIIFWGDLHSDLDPWKIIISSTIYNMWNSATYNLLLSALLNANIYSEESDFNITYHFNTVN